MLTTVEAGKTFMEKMMDQVKELDFSEQQVLIADYMVDQEYTLELVALINLHKKRFMQVFRGARFLASEIYEGNVISLGDHLISTTTDENVAVRFSFNTLSDSILEVYSDEFDDHELEERVDQLYGFCVFEIEEVEGVYLNNFFEEKNQFTHEKEVLTDQDGLFYKVLKVEPFSNQYPQVNRVTIRNIAQNN